MRMKKIVLALMLIAVIMGLTACGQKKEISGESIIKGSQSRIEETDTRESVSEDKETEEKSEEKQDPAADQEKSYDISDLESILAAMTTEFEEAAQSIENESVIVFEKIGGKYASYAENKDVVTDYYNNSLHKADTLYGDVEGIAIDYFKCVANQGIEDYNIWNDAMRDLYDTWDDGIKDLYDVWDDIYKEIYDKCDELIKDASDDLAYNEYSSVWSAMYQEYSNAWSAMYKSYSDAWSSTYKGYSAVRSGFYKGETDVEAILEEASEAASEETKEDIVEETVAESTESIVEESVASTEEASDDDKIFGSEDWRQFLADYEAWVDDYIALFKKYKENPSDLSILADYTKMLYEMTEWSEKAGNMELEIEDTKEALEYSTELLRIAAKLAEASYK